ncbi:gp53-like domain-containing protein [Citrobacter freundii]
MSKIARYQGNVRAFASDAQGMERTVFGGTNQADDLTSQITASFLRGWGIVGASEHPSLEDFNAAMYAMSQFIAYQHQMGVPEWHAQQEYHIGSICTHNGESYQSLQDANVGSPPPSAKWTPVLTSKNGLANLGLDTALAGKQAKDDTLTNLSGKTVAQLLTYLTLGPIANASDIAAGSANKLIDAYGLNSYFPSRRFGTSGYIRIPNQPGGLILQWGPIPVIPAGGHVNVNYGFAFPEAYLVVIPIAGSSSGAANSVLSGGAGDPKLSFQVFNSLPGVTDGTGTGAYIALGF